MPNNDLNDRAQLRATFTGAPRFRLPFAAEARECEFREGQAADKRFLQYEIHWRDRFLAGSSSAQGHMDTGMVRPGYLVNPPIESCLSNSSLYW
jgi:hypothetical protein